MNDERAPAAMRADRTTRARRFKIEMDIRYRAAGEQAWHAGKTRDISRSGVLFSAESLLDRGNKVEMRFTLPVKSAAALGAEVVCSGDVVRRVASALPGETGAIAASIAKYRISRQTPRQTN